MSDFEGSWKHNGRPQSTVARNFSATLNDAFSMGDSADGNLKGLLDSVEQRKQAVTSQTQELEALEARLRETEERLRQKQVPTPSPAGKSSANYNSHQRQPLGTTFGRQEDDMSHNMSTSALSAQQQRVHPSKTKAVSYQTTATPDALQQTPEASSNRV